MINESRSRAESRVRGGARRLAAFAALALGASVWGAEPREELADESRASLFQAELGEGKDAELLVQGSWKLTLLSSLTLDFPAGGGLDAGASQPLLFLQEPDLLLEFLLYDRFFVEARVSEDLSQARWAMGYRGLEGETLRELRLGNRGIGARNLPYIAAGEGGQGSFGVLLRAEGGDFRGEALLRYDQAERVSKRFIGSAELVETRGDIRSFIRGRWFMLPAAPTGEVALYVESGSGGLAGSDGARYRAMAASEYAVSLVTGVVSLGKAAESRVLAVYAGAPADLLLEGSAAALLFDPDIRGGANELLHRYPLPSSGADESSVLDLASGASDPGFLVRRDSAGQWLEVLALGAEEPGDPGYGKPFAALSSESWIYAWDPDDETVADWLLRPGYAISSLGFGGAGRIAIDADYLEGSLELRRNGVRDTGFTVNADYEVVLSPPPGASEEIELSYLRASSERRAGSLVAGLSGSLDLGGDRLAWAGLGARFALPGESFAAEGGANPGWAALAAGLEKSAGALRYRASTALSWNLEEVSGRYRIEGMESAASSLALSSFAPVGALPAGFTAEEGTDSLLAELFPSAVALLHRDGREQKALRLDFGGVAGAASLSRVLEAPPLASLLAFSFYARGSSTASLEVELSDGSAPALSVELLAGTLTTAWRKYSVRYGRGETTVLVQADEDSPAVALAGSEATAVVDLSRSGAARLELRVTGDAGDTVWVDEILLEDSAGSLALLAEGRLSWEDPASSGLSLSIDGRAAVHASPNASLSASTGARLGPLSISLNARVDAAEDAFGAGAGHGLVLDAGPLSLEEDFSLPGLAGAFSRLNTLVLDAGRAGGFSLSGGVAWTPGAAGGGAGLLAQDWKASLDLAGVAKAGLEAANRSRPAAAPGLPGGYAAAWVESFAWLLPAEESASRSRRIAASLSVAPGGREYARAGAALSAEPAVSGLRLSEAGLRAALPLELGEGLELELYYDRSWSSDATGNGPDILALAGSGFGDLLRAAPLWRGIPFAELIGESSRDLLLSSSPASGDWSRARYVPRSGLLLARPFGSRPLDLLLPSKLQVSFRRELLLEGGSLSDAGVWELGGTTAALNLFGSAGAAPTRAPFESDEYLSTLTASLRARPGAPASEAALSLSLQNLAAFYGKSDAGSPGSLVLENRLAWTGQPSGTSWSERFAANLSLRRERSVFLSLYEALVARAAGKGAEAPAPGSVAAEAGGGEGRSRIVSAYLSGLAAATARARTLVGLGVEVSGARSDAASPSTGFALSQSLEQRVTVPERLSAQAVASLAERRDGSTGLLSLTATLSLSLTLSF